MHIIARGDADLPKFLQKSIESGAAVTEGKPSRRPNPCICQYILARQNGSEHRSTGSVGPIPGAERAEVVSKWKTCGCTCIGRLHSPRADAMIASCTEGELDLAKRDIA